MSRAVLIVFMPIVFMISAVLIILGGVSPVLAQREGLAPITGVQAQPLIAQVRRLVESLQFMGSPLPPADVKKLESAFKLPGPEAVIELQRVLAKNVLIAVHINPESRVKVARGRAAAELMQQGWRTFLVRVHNEAGVTARLAVESPNSLPVYKRSGNGKEPEISVRPADIDDRWADVQSFDRRPLLRELSGLELEYRILEIYSRDVGKREAKILFNVGQGTQDIGFRNEVSILFECSPAVKVVFDIKDWDGANAMANFIIRDGRGRVYPSPSRRLAPDFFFHPQIYRTSGETIHLPAGTYDVEYSRGPEYLLERLEMQVPEGVKSFRQEFRLHRWIHPKALNWYSGDHHVHAAGCSHYESPTQGVTPEDMMRHILGEDLNVGCVLSWGPCWYFQKRFFKGDVSSLSRPNHLMRYDVEVSGFPSDHTGHLCLLRLKEDDYPGTKRTEEWPSWGLPILEWGHKQGGVVGYSHSGWGLAVETSELPNYVIPPFDSIGANEYIATVTTGIVDFISSVDTPYVWELNIWYHTLNCGFRARLSGETDFPCIYGERVGLGRIYAKLDKLDFDLFCDALKAGRSYVGDGRSHLIDFKVGSRDVGVEGSELRIRGPQSLFVRVKAAAYLEIEARPEIKKRSYQQKPYWHIERARIEGSRKIPVEVVVNGEPVARREIEADGVIRDLKFDIPIERSSWVAVRVLASSHSNPVFVIVDDRPIRASKKSAEWCLKSVDRCWSQKKTGIRPAELPAAKKAYDAARLVYRKILRECPDE